MPDIINTLLRFLFSKDKEAHPLSPEKEARLFQTLSHETPKKEVAKHD